MAAVMVVAASSLLRSGMSLRQLQAHASSLRVWGAAVQSGLACAVLLLWSRLVNLAVRRGIVPDAEREVVMGLRPRLAVFLAAYLVFVAFGLANTGAFLRLITRSLG
jgi:hypothetical protein